MRIDGSLPLAISLATWRGLTLSLAATSLIDMASISVSCMFRK